ncbi:Brix domain-containing protein [Stygiolobus caldivivus]|uniref:Probable Brix domain-containing ribosomal biogenesis protein n=1 Tax=Stygiolobus caldivivus TaxID=2824673 RepID=A0A8D5U7S6_9CREN|nr:Brix domain-containing protein [Stygiolobus caldivivus]BCU70625.1 hypothetical protein KN1_19220 [Stygiolobus caldivivus]
MPIPRTRVILTSSRDAPLRVRSFLNELEYVIPFSKRINRGRQNLESIIYKARLFQASYLIIIGIKKGNPSSFVVYDLYTSSIKYKLRIFGITLVNEIRNDKVKTERIKRGCIGSLDDDEIRHMFIDLGYYSLSKCDAYVSGKIVILGDRFKKLYEIKFLDYKNNILGPIIRFIYDESSN